MLTGDGGVSLRALRRDEVERVAAWEVDVDTWRLAADSAYVPRTPADLLKDYDEGKGPFRTGPTGVPFAIDVAGVVVGVVSLWGIDLHNRRAHLGISLAPDARGRGYGSAAIVVLLRYAFRDRGLHRVQLEVLADNARAIAAYRRAGFVEEGRARDDAWVDGRFVDQVVMSVLSTDPGRHRDPV